MFTGEINPECVEFFYNGLFVYNYGQFKAVIIAGLISKLEKGNSPITFEVMCTGAFDTQATMTSIGTATIFPNASYGTTLWRYSKISKGMDNHIEADTRWPISGRGHFQIHFREWKYMYLGSSFTEICSQWSNMMELIQIMAWHRLRGRSFTNDLGPSLLAHRCHIRHWCCKCITWYISMFCQVYLRNEIIWKRCLQNGGHFVSVSMC